MSDVFPYKFEVGEIAILRMPWPHSINGCEVTVLMPPDWRLCMFRGKPQQMFVYVVHSPRGEIGARPEWLFKKKPPSDVTDVKHEEEMTV
jgi:hypothetical protein